MDLLDDYTSSFFLSVESIEGFNLTLDVGLFNNLPRYGNFACFIINLKRRQSEAIMMQHNAQNVRSLAPSAAISGVRAGSRRGQKAQKPYLG